MGTWSSLLELWSQRLNQGGVRPDLGHMSSSVPEIPALLRLSNSFLLTIKDNFNFFFVCLFLLLFFENMATRKQNPQGKVEKG